MGSRVGHPSPGPPASSASLPGPSSPADRPTVDFGMGWALVSSTYEGAVLRLRGRETGAPT
jgi:hypothetical protein